MLLAHNLLGYGSKLFANNWHTSQPLSEYLLVNQTVATLQQEEIVSTYQAIQG